MTVPENILLQKKALDGEKGKGRKEEREVTGGEGMVGERPGPTDILA